jgi:hypothetical protein
VSLAIQGVIVPLVIALVVAIALSRLGWAWLAIVAGFVAMTTLTTGFDLTPLTAARKTLLLGLAAPVIGMVADRLGTDGRRVTAGLAIVAGIAAAWTFLSVLRQVEGAGAYVRGAALAGFVALLVALVLSLREDGIKTGAAGVGLGVATGVAGVVSASVGFLLAGAALAASAGALLVIQALGSRQLPAGFTGALSIGMLAALFAAGAVLLAQMPWYALPALLLIPLAARLPTGKRTSTIARSTALFLYMLVAAVPVVAIAWHAARQGSQ